MKMVFKMVVIYRMEVISIDHKMQTMTMKMKLCL